MVAPGGAAMRGTVGELVALVGLLARPAHTGQRNCLLPPSKLRCGDHR